MNKVRQQQQQQQKQKELMALTHENVNADADAKLTECQPATTTTITAMTITKLNDKKTNDNNYNANHDNNDVDCENVKNEQNIMKNVNENLNANVNEKIENVNEKNVNESDGGDKHKIAGDTNSEMMITKVVNVSNAQSGDTATATTTSFKHEKMNVNALTCTAAATTDVPVAAVVVVEKEETATRKSLQCQSENNNSNSINKHNNINTNNNSSSTSSSIITVAVDNKTSKQQKQSPRSKISSSSSSSSLSSLSSNDSTLTMKQNSFFHKTETVRKTATVAATAKPSTSTAATEHRKRQQFDHNRNNDNNNRSQIQMNDSINDRQLLTKQPRPVLLSAVNPHIICSLCFGYLIDATTIVECLHSFCHSCLIKHLRTQEYCPRCEMVINTAKPNIKPDTTLQAIVYKLVPALYERELLRKRAFYKNRPKDAALATPEQRGDDTEHLIFSPSEYMSLSLEYADANELCMQQNVEYRELLKPRYIKCPAMCTVFHIKKMVFGKFQVDTNRFIIDIMYKVKTIVLLDHYTLMDVAYIYTWKRDAPMRFYFRIKQRLKPLIRVRKHLATNKITNNISNNNNDNTVETLSQNDSNEVKQIPLISTTTTTVATIHIITSTTTITNAIANTATTTSPTTIESIKVHGDENVDSVSVEHDDVQEKLLEPEEIKVENESEVSSSTSEMANTELKQCAIMTQTSSSPFSVNASNTRETESLKITLISKTPRDKIDRKTPTSLKMQHKNEKDVHKISSQEAMNQHHQPYHQQHNNNKDDRKVENIKLKIDLSKQNSVTIINMSDSNSKGTTKLVRPDKEWKVKTKKDKDIMRSNSLNARLLASPQNNATDKTRNPSTVPDVTMKATKWPISILPSTSLKESKANDVNEEDDKKSQFLKSFSLTPIKAAKFKLSPESERDSDKIEAKPSSIKFHDNSNICGDLKSLLPTTPVKPPLYLDLAHKTCTKRKIKEPMKTIVKKAKLSALPTSPVPLKDFKIKLLSGCGNNTNINTMSPFKPPKLPPANSEDNKFVKPLMPPPLFPPGLKSNNSPTKHESRFQSQSLKATTLLMSGGGGGSNGGSLTVNQYAHGIQIAPPGNRTPIAKRYQPILPKATRPNPFANIPADVNKLLKQAGTEIKTISNDNTYCPKVYGPKLDDSTFIRSPTKINQHNNQSNQHKLEIDLTNNGGAINSSNQRHHRHQTGLISNATNTFGQNIINMNAANANTHPNNNNSTNNYFNLALFNATKSKVNEIPSACRTPIYTPNSPIYSPSSPQYVSNYNIPTMPTYKYTPKPITNTNNYNNNNNNNNGGNNKNFLQNIMNATNQKVANLFPNPPEKRDTTPVTTPTKSTAAPQTVISSTSSTTGIIKTTTRNNNSGPGKHALNQQQQQQQTDGETLTTITTTATTTVACTTTDVSVVGNKRPYSATIRSPSNLCTDGGKNYNNCNNSDDPPEKQLKVKSLLTSCNINIPSSLSITITREDGESPANHSTYPKHKSPVNNYIEILKLPDPLQAPSNQCSDINNSNSIINNKPRSVAPPTTHSTNILINSQQQQQQQQQHQQLQQQKHSSNMNQQRLNNEPSPKHDHNKPSTTLMANNSVRIPMNTNMTNNINNSNNHSNSGSNNKNSNNNHNNNNSKSNSNTISKISAHTVTNVTAATSILTSTTSTVAPTQTAQCFNTSHRNLVTNTNRILNNLQKLSTSNQMNENANGSPNQQKAHNNNISKSVLSPVKTPSPEKKLSSSINSNSNSSISHNNNNSSNSSSSNTTNTNNNEQKSPKSPTSMERNGSSSNSANGKRFRHILPRQMHQPPAATSIPQTTITKSLATAAETVATPIATLSTTLPTEATTNVMTTTKKSTNNIEICDGNVGNTGCNNSNNGNGKGNSNNGNVIDTCASPNGTAAIKMHCQRKMPASRKSNGQSAKSMLAPKINRQTIACSNVAQQNIKNNCNCNNNNNHNNNNIKTATLNNKNNNLCLALNSSTTSNNDNITAMATLTNISPSITLPATMPPPTLPTHLGITVAAAAAAAVHHQAAAERVDVNKIFKENLFRAQVQAAAAANSSNIFYSYAAANAAAAQMSQFTPMYNYQQALIIEQLSRMQRVGNEAFTEYMQKLKGNIIDTATNKTVVRCDQKGIPQSQSTSISTSAPSCTSASASASSASTSISISKLTALQQSKCMAIGNAKALMPSPSQSSQSVSTAVSTSPSSASASLSPSPSYHQMSPTNSEKSRMSTSKHTTHTTTTPAMTTTTTATTTSTITTKLMAINSAAATVSAAPAPALTATTTTTTIMPAKDLTTSSATTPTTQTPTTSLTTTVAEASVSPALESPVSPNTLTETNKQTAKVK